LALIRPRLSQVGDAPVRKNPRPDRRSLPLPYDDEGMSGTAAPRPDGSEDLLAAYDETLPHVYGYLLSRCGQATVAEDLHRPTSPSSSASSGAFCRSRASAAWV